MAELIEEESAARKLGKKMKREEEEEETNSEPQPLDSPTSNPSDKKVIQIIRRLWSRVRGPRRTSLQRRRTGDLRRATQVRWWSIV